MVLQNFPGLACLQVTIVSKYLTAWRFDELYPYFMTSLAFCQIYRIFAHIVVIVMQESWMLFVAGWTDHLIFDIGWGRGRSVMNHCWTLLSPSPESDWWSPGPLQLSPCMVLHILQLLRPTFCDPAIPTNHQIHCTVTYVIWLWIAETSLLQVMASNL